MAPPAFHVLERVAARRNIPNFARCGNGRPQSAPTHPMHIHMDGPVQGTSAQCNPPKYRPHPHAARSHRCAIAEAVITVGYRTYTTKCAEPRN